MTTYRRYYRLGVGVALATALFLILGSGAVGIIGAGGQPDRIYAAVLAVLVVGTVIARLRPAGMAVVLAATALAQSSSPRPRCWPDCTETQAPRSSTSWA
jgi:hypothetical protein